MSIENEATAASPNSQQLEVIKGKWVALSEDEKMILGKPNFTCGRIAERMRQMGFECKTKAEEEQALVIFTMLQFYNEHGNEWIEKMNEFLKPS